MMVFNECLLTCLSPEKKMYSFLAYDPLNILSWLASIKEKWTIDSKSGDGLGEVIAEAKSILDFRRILILL